MKEFIEKLIGRLEEECEWAKIHGTDESFRKGRISGLNTAKRIANELAEEYKGKLDDEWQIIYNKILNLEKKYTNERNIESVKDCIRLENLLQYFKEELRSEEKYINTSTGTSSGWIPCSERLPEESLDSVLGWDEYRNRCCFVQYISGRWVLGNDIDSVKIIAWMPLPASYKEGCE